MACGQSEQWRTSLWGKKIKDIGISITDMKGHVVTLTATSTKSLVDRAESFKCYYTKIEVVIGLLSKYLEIPIEAAKHERISSSSKEQDQHNYHHAALISLTSKSNPFHELLRQGTVQTFLHDAKRFRNQWTHRKKNHFTDASIYNNMPSQQEFVSQRKELEDALDIALACVMKEASRRAYHAAPWEAMRFQEKSFDIREHKLIQRERRLEARERELEKQFEQQKEERAKEQEHHERNITKLTSSIRLIEDIRADLADPPRAMFCDDGDETPISVQYKQRRKFDYLQIARCLHKEVVKKLASEKSVLESRIAALEEELKSKTAEAKTQ